MDGEHFLKLVSDLERQARDLVSNLARQHSELELQRSEINNLKSDLEHQRSTIDRQQYEIETQRSTIDRQQSELEDQRSTIDRQQSELEAQRSTIDRQQSELETQRSTIETQQSEIDRLRAELEHYHTTYQELDEAYELYRALDSNVKSSLYNVFNDDSGVLGFFSGALQQKHLDHLWDYTKNVLNNRQVSDQDAKRLVKLLDFCFQAVELGAGHPYVRLQPETGSDFNPSAMIRSSDSRQNGTVSHVILNGYAHHVSGKVVRPSLVSLL